MEKKKKELYCSECGAKIEDNYYFCLDNFLQVKFFDTDEENCFCSQECFCKYLSLTEINENLTDQERDFAKLITGEKKI